MGGHDGTKREANRNCPPPPPQKHFLDNLIDQKRHPSVILNPASKRRRAMPRGTSAARNKKRCRQRTPDYIEAEVACGGVEKKKLRG